MPRIKRVINYKGEKIKISGISGIMYEAKVRNKIVAISGRYQDLIKTSKSYITRKLKK